MTLQQQISALEGKMTQLEDAMSFLFNKLDALTVIFRDSDAHLKALITSIERSGDEK